MKNKILLIIVILGLALTASCSRTGESKQSAIFDTGDIENIKIVSENAESKAGFGDNFPVVGRFKRGDILDVVGRFRDWYVVPLPDKKVGVVDSDDAKPVVIEDETEQEQEQQQEQEKEVEEVESYSEKERRMVNLVNQERQKQNLNPLKVDPELTRLARMKSQDMVKNNYFSHYSPTYGSPFDMLDKYGVEYVAAGENIAANSSVDNAHSSLMNSEGHRRNILNPQFTHIGIGIVNSDKYGNMITQLFISRPQ